MSAERSVSVYPHSTQPDLHSMSSLAQEDVIEQVRNLKFNHEVIHHEFEAVRRALQSIEGYAKGSKRAECQRMLEDWNRHHEVRS